jgi:hypothetical protein
MIFNEEKAFYLCFARIGTNEDGSSILGILDQVTFESIYLDLGFSIHGEGIQFSYQQCLDLINDQRLSYTGADCRTLYFYKCAYYDKDLIKIPVFDANSSSIFFYDLDSAINNLQGNIDNLLRESPDCLKSVIDELINYCEFKIDILKSSKNDKVTRSKEISVDDVKSLVESDYRNLERAIKAGLLPIEDISHFRQLESERLEQSMTLLKSDLARSLIRIEKKLIIAQEMICRLLINPIGESQAMRKAINLK